MISLLRVVNVLLLALTLGTLTEGQLGGQYGNQSNDQYDGQYGVLSGGQYRNQSSGQDDGQSSGQDDGQSSDQDDGQSSDQDDGQSSDQDDGQSSGQLAVRSGGCSGICEDGAECRMSGDVPTCFCQPGYVFEDYRCKRYEKPPEPQGPRCDIDSSCSNDRQCIGGYCINPCGTESCGRGLCAVKQHQRRCWVIRSSSGSRCEMTGESLLQKKFEFVDAELPWVKAQSYCWERDMILATIDTKEDQIELENYLPQFRDKVGQGSLWLGSREYADKNFFWTETGALFSDGFTNWWSGYVDGKTVTCPGAYPHKCLATSPLGYSRSASGADVAIAKWCNYDCQNNQKFVCQYYQLGKDKSSENRK